MMHIALPQLALCRRVLLMAVAAMMSATAPAATLNTADGTRVEVTTEVAKLTAEGLAALKNRAFDVAVSRFTAALARKPDAKAAVMIYDLRCTAYLHRKDATRALSDANDAIRLDPQYAAAYALRGVAYRQQGDFDRAIAEYNNAIRINPRFAPAYYNRGLAYGHKGQNARAIKEYDEAIRLNPRYADAYHNRGADYHILGNFPKAVADYTQAIRYDPQMVNAYSNRASTYEKLGEYGKAQADYRRAVRSIATDGEQYSNRAWAKTATGDYQGAARDYAKARQLEPSNEAVLNSVAWFRATCPEASLRNGKEAVELAMRSCRASNWKDAANVDTLAAAHAEAGDFEQAVQYQTRAIAMENDAKEKRDKEKRLAQYRSGKPWRLEPKLARQAAAQQ